MSTLMQGERAKAAKGRPRRLSPLRWVCMEESTLPWRLPMQRLLPMCRDNDPRWRGILLPVTAQIKPARLTHRLLVAAVVLVIVPLWAR